MKIIWCYLLAAFVAVSMAAIDVEKTVRQVQSILQANQQLPRLTRDEIMQLLNDIRSEDGKSSSSSSSSSSSIELEEEEVDRDKVPSQYSSIVNDMNLPLPNTLDNIAGDKDIIFDKTTVPPISIFKTTKYNKPTKSVSPEYDETPEKSVSLQKLYPQVPDTPTPIPSYVPETTTESKPKLMVVLPYTPRDGSSLQELYTRPPRVEVVHVSSTTAKPDTPKYIESHSSKVKFNLELPTELVNNFPGELQAFLDAHGLTGKPGQDHFLLPLEGFKPLPPAKVVDGSVQLPENILLTYDLIAPSSNSKTNSDDNYSITNNYLYSPLRPEPSFELDSSASETKEVSLPYDMPVKKSKSITSPNFDPIEYDSVKVIPLSKGINPINEEISTSNEQSKRQVTNEEEKKEVTSTTTEEPKTNVISETAPVDTGASLSDLEASFGGAASSQAGDSQLPPPKKNGFYWMLDWNSFLEVGDGDTKVNIRLEPKLGDPQMFLPVTVP